MHGDVLKLPIYTRVISDTRYNGASWCSYEHWAM